MQETIRSKWSHRVLTKIHIPKIGFCTKKYGFQAWKYLNFQTIRKTNCLMCVLRLWVRATEIIFWQTIKPSERFINTSNPLEEFHKEITNRLFDWSLPKKSKWRRF